MLYENARNRKLHDNRIHSWFPYVKAHWASHFIFCIASRAVRRGIALRSSDVYDFFFNKREDGRLWLSVHAKDSRTCEAVRHISKCNIRKWHNRHCRAKRLAVSEYSSPLNTLCYLRPNRLSFFFRIDCNCSEHDHGTFFLSEVGWRDCRTVRGWELFLVIQHLTIMSKVQK